MTKPAKAYFVEQSIRMGSARLSDTGALLVETGAFTGRAANYRYLVRHPEIENEIDWGQVNKPMDPAAFHEIESVLRHNLSQNEVYEYEGFAGPVKVTVKSRSSWHISFAQNMFREAPIQALAEQVEGVGAIEVLHEPWLSPQDLGLNLNAPAVIVLDPRDLKVCIIGTAYAGEIKKSVFTLCNFLMPRYGILPMHSSANCEPGGRNTCVLFGLSGTGKTTLSASPDRLLIGDDEILWSDTGISNIEGGCYAKLIDLSEEKEPEIYRAVNRFGAIMENVVYDEKTRIPDFKNGSRTENTRGSYDLSHLDSVYDQNVQAQAPRSIVFLTADAFGAMPAVARLTPEQAQYHFLSGYTAKVAGTEMGVKEPQAAFSACFGAPFMPRPPQVYAQLLAKMAQKYETPIWLLNTGWTQGGYGKGSRFPLAVSRQILRTIQSGEALSAPTKTHPVFGFEVPTELPGVEAKWLEIPNNPEVERLALRFEENMRRFLKTPTEMIAGGPTAAL